MRTALNKGGDLRLTADVDTLFKAVLAGHLGVEEGKLDTRVFPDSGKLRARERLLA